MLTEVNAEDVPDAPGVLPSPLIVIGLRRVSTPTTMRMTKTRPTVERRRMYSLGETCRLLGVGRTTMWRARKAGVAEFKETDGGLMMSGAAILALWERRNITKKRQDNG